MTTQASPASTASALRGKLERARASAQTLREERERAHAKVASAAAAGDLELELKARERLVAIDSALADAEAKIVALTAALAAAAAAAADEQAVTRIAGLLETYVGGVAQFVAEVQRTHTHLARGVAAAARLRLTAGDVLGAAHAEIQHAGGSLLANDGPRRTRALDLLGQLEERGVDASALRALQRRDSTLEGLPELAPYGATVYTLVAAAIQQRQLEANRPTPTEA